MEFLSMEFLSSGLVTNFLLLALLFWLYVLGSNVVKQQAQTLYVLRGFSDETFRFFSNGHDSERTPNMLVGIHHYLERTNDMLEDLADIKEFNRQISRCCHSTSALTITDVVENVDNKLGEIKKKL